MATNHMITLNNVQINSLNLYYTEELTALKAEAVSQAEKMHAAGAIVKIIYSRTRKGNKYIIMDRRAA